MSIEELRRSGMQPGRNFACPCGSGRKYKRCCGQQHAAAVRSHHAAPAADLNPNDLREFATLIDQRLWGAAELRATAALRTRPEVGMLWKILGVALVRQGKEALPALQRAAQLLPADVEAQCNFGATLLSLARWREALTIFRQVLQLSPDHREALIHSADILHRVGESREAAVLYERALQRNPGSQQLRNNLGNALFELGEYEAAAECYRAAIRLKPDDAKIHSNLGNALRRLGRLQEALDSGRRAVALSPGMAEAHNHLGLALAALGEFEQARTAYRTALSLNPNDIDALNNLGNTLRDFGERSEAATFYRRAIELDPLHAESRCNLGNLLFEIGHLAEAAESYANALALKPSSKEAHLSLGMVQRLLGRAADAEASCRSALTLDPNYAEALALLGELRGDRGQFADAQALFQRAAAADPQLPSVLFNIAMHRKMTSSDTEWLERTEALLARRLSPRHEISLRHALGKYCDDVGQFARAFDNHRQANELTKRAGPKYEAAELVAQVDRIIGNFDAQSIHSAQARGSTSERPVFIVGMPRSGTSLTEQILASHPAVFGAGELTFWDGALSSVWDTGDARRVRAERIPTMAAEYLSLLARLSPGAPRVVDKLPANFMNVGLIHAAFPRARIIHMRRHPLDTCLSVYCQYFPNAHFYGNDLGSLAHYYGQYVRIMDHWRRALPATALLEVQYESLIADQELWSRRLLDFIGLPWDPRCLAFDETNRTVITASKWQVRQKIHSSSSGRWRNYQSFLAPLLPLVDL